MSMKIILPGALSTIQDGGRPGYMQFGITPGGAMDYAAYRTANHLVGNPEGAAVIEMTLMGLTALFTEETVISLTGADMRPCLDGRAIPLYEAVRVAPGETLQLGMAVNGCRTYLAIRGGFDLPLVMGSRSTNVRCGLGGLEGRALQKGDQLESVQCQDHPRGRIEPAETPGEDQAQDKRSISWAEQQKVERRSVRVSAAGSAAEAAYPLAEREMTGRQRYEKSVGVRVVEGPQADAFTEEGRALFYQTRYEVQAESDRMGMRLAGPRVEAAYGYDIVSDAIVFGSVQITNAGTPIIMMADHQTTGGYAKIATVCSFDLPKLAQLQPGDRVSFQRISPEEADLLYENPEERYRDHSFVMTGRSAGRIPDRDKEQKCFRIFGGGWHRSKRRCRPGSCRQRDTYGIARPARQHTSMKTRRTK